MQDGKDEALAFEELAKVPIGHVYATRLSLGYGPSPEPRAAGLCPVARTPLETVLVFLTFLLLISGVICFGQRTCFGRFRLLPLRRFVCRASVWSVLVSGPRAPESVCFTSAGGLVL